MWPLVLHHKHQPKYSPLWPGMSHHLLFVQCTKKCKYSNIHSWLFFSIICHYVACVWRQFMIIQEHPLYFFLCCQLRSFCTIPAYWCFSLSYFSWTASHWPTEAVSKLQTVTLVEGNNSSTEKEVTVSAHSNAIFNKTPLLHCYQEMEAACHADDLS